MSKKSRTAYDEMRTEIDIADSWDANNPQDMLASQMIFVSVTARALVDIAEKLVRLIETLENRPA